MQDTLLKYLYRMADRETDIAFSYKPGLRRQRLTYSGLASAASQFARELEARNIVKGDRVMIWAENCPEWVVAFYGSLMRGVVVVPLDEQSAPEFVKNVIEQTNPKLLLGGKQADFSEHKIQTLALNNLEKQISLHSAELYKTRNISRGDLAEIVFTSGTTSVPKGVRLTHENLLANIEALEDEIKKYQKLVFLVHPLKFLCLLPLSHVFGQMMGIFIPPLLRGEVVFQNRFTPSSIIRTIKRERISIAASVPRVLETLRNKIESDYEDKGGTLDDFYRQRENSRNPLTRWWKFRRTHREFGMKFWCFVTGGATLNTETERFWSKLGFAVVQGYGMTETAALISVNNPFNAKRGSLGEILLGQEVKIGEQGEILVRGKNVAHGYSGENGTSSGNEWLDTGDVGSVDENGRLYFKGRKKEVIVTSAGLNIYPEDLEAALNRQPEILDSAVLGVEAAKGEETVAALIVRQGSDTNSAVVRANDVLAGHQQIRRWFVWSEPDFPRTPTQKIRKAKIADFIRQNPVQNGDGGRTSQASDLSGLIDRIRQESGSSVESEARLGADLQFDSLSRSELLGAIEDRYQIDLDESEITETTTVAEIEEMIQGESGNTGENVQRRRSQVPPSFSHPYWSLGFPASWIRLIFHYVVMYPLTRIMCWVKVRGLENLRSLETPVVFAANHVTLVDSPLIMSALPNRFRMSLAIAMGGERLKRYRYPAPDTPIFTKMRQIFQYWASTTLMNAFPLPKRGDFRKSFDYAGEVIDAGYNVLIFPEGELTEDGKLQKLRKGIGLLAEGLKVPIVPVVFKGLYEAKIKGRRFVRPGSVTVVFGKPVFHDPKDSVSAITCKIENRFKSLLAEGKAQQENSKSF